MEGVSHARLPGAYASTRLSPSSTLLATCKQDGYVSVLQRCTAEWTSLTGSLPYAASPDAFAWLADTATSCNEQASWLVIAGHKDITFVSVAEQSYGSSSVAGRAVICSVASLSLSAAASARAPAPSGAASTDVTVSPAGQHGALTQALRCRVHSLVTDAHHRTLVLLHYVQGAPAVTLGSCAASMHLVATVFRAATSCVERAAAFPLCCATACACAALSWQSAAVSGSLLVGLELGGQLTVWDWRQGGGVPVASYRAAALSKATPPALLIPVTRRNNLQKRRLSVPLLAFGAAQPGSSRPGLR